MKKIVYFILVIGMVLILKNAYGGSTATISVTVSLEETVSISLDTNTWNIGSISLGATVESSAFTVTNDGNVAEDISIKATNGAGGWTIGTTPGENVFKVAADVEPYSSYDIVLSTTDTVLITNLASGNSKSFKLQYSAPTSDTYGGGVDQSFTITLTATKH